MSLSTKLFLRSSAELKNHLGAELSQIQKTVKIEEKSTGKVSPWLEMRGEKLTLVHPLGELSLDFLSDSRYQRRGHRGKSELIAKALGSQRGVKSVFDGTLGLGEDAIFLTQLGFHVTGCERSPWIYLLLKDAERRARAADSDFSLQVQFGAAQNFFAEMAKASSDERPAMIFIDPMFPEKKKTALPRKEMQIFRDVVGEDDDATTLFEYALKATRQGVVVKRPLRAPPLLPTSALESGFYPVTHSFLGKTVRYDLYSVK
jgi:hypothetical protein